MKLSTLAVLIWAAPAAAEKSTCEDFNTGVYLGADIAEALWDSMGGSCSSVWGFEDEVDDYLDYYYPTDTNDWRTNSCNEGVEAGADQVVAKYEKECLDSSPDECYDLGHAAAQQIAFGFCPFSGASDEAQPYGMPNYKESCREVAYGICEGAIYGYVNENGCSIKTSQLQDLQDECEDLIDAMTGGEEEKKAVKAKTDEKKTESVKKLSVLTDSFVETAAAAQDLSNCFRKCESKYEEGTDAIENCRSNCRAGNNRTGRDYKNSRNQDYQDGLVKGEQEAEKIWRRNGSTCNTIWSFEDDVDEMLDDKYWQDTSFNEGVEDGAEAIVEKYEKECLEDDPEECEDLGEAAAQEIAYDFCPPNVSGQSGGSHSPPNYKKSCRSVAYGVCKGEILDEVRDNGCNPTTSEVNTLQNKCQRQVNSMTNGMFARVIRNQKND